MRCPDYAIFAWKKIEFFAFNCVHGVAGFHGENIGDYVARRAAAWRECDQNSYDQRAENIRNAPADELPERDRRYQLERTLGLIAWGVSTIFKHPNCRNVSKLDYCEFIMQVREHSFIVAYVALR